LAAARRNQGPGVFSTVPSRGSGFPEADLRRAISAEVAKTNVNTELRAAYFGCLKDELDASAATLDLKRLGERLTEAATKVVEDKLDTFGWTA
jgi:fructose/tagatose bisphosphate aldolase